MATRDIIVIGGRYPVAEEIEIEARIAAQLMDGKELIAGVERLGKISRLTCPDCHGALWEINDDVGPDF